VSRDSAGFALDVALDGFIAAESDNSKVKDSQQDVQSVRRNWKPQVINISAR